MKFAAHNTFTKNYANRGGAICCDWRSTMEINNTILWENAAVYGHEISLGGELWPSTLTISYSDVDGGLPGVHVEPNCTLNWNNGMIAMRPKFAGSNIGDYRLTWNSPCRDAGDNYSVVEDHDFEGDPRIHNVHTDIGADEFHLRLYEVGELTAGSNIQIRVAGEPSDPVWLLLGSGIQDPPMPTYFGDFYLEFPIIHDFDLGLIPDNGILEFPVRVPGNALPGSLYPFQALVQADFWVLTNFMPLTIE